MWKSDTMPKYSKDIAVYKGDEFICMGTVEEVARYMDIKPDSIYRHVWEQKKGKLNKIYSYYWIEEDD